ncbi:zinc finger protein 564 isoform X3 [Syngnathoides biaculeatus]|uniref:zinc finger protein 564 isoform X3 n=1 Tax=Syngnathoides biaculeatus TaxID=300417 RepID=UPI002ADD9AEB|nr:zinc finger protein 564 isoform X3 [Syngnathoides biaculeatus]
MEQVPAVLTEDVQPEKQSTVMDGTSANNDLSPTEDTADSKCPASVQAKRSKVAQDRGPASTTTTLEDSGAPRTVQKDDRDIKVEGNVESEKNFQTSADDPNMRGSSPTEGSMKYVYKCQICGKVYMYLLSFQKHLELHTGEAPTPKNPIGEGARKYECPVCAMEFYRKTRLRSHLLTHVSREVHKCDQCNKTFDSLSLWQVHEEFHKTRPFWCLSCSKGFMQEDYLNRHLQRHHLGHYKCFICSKRFLTSRLFRDHLGSSHASSPLVTGGAVLKKAGDESVTEDGSALTAGDRDEREPPTFVETEVLQTSGNLESSGEFSQSVSDCGETAQRPPKSPTSPAGEELRNVGQSQTTQEVSGGKQPEQNQRGGYREHWEFECFECGMGFDDITPLHLHYIKHATGDVPFPDAEG